MVATLVLIGIGICARMTIQMPFDIVILMNMEAPKDGDFAFYKDPRIQYHWHEILFRFLGSSMISIAVFVNIVRWAILYLTMRKIVGNISEQAYYRSKVFVYTLLSLCVIL